MRFTWLHLVSAAIGGVVVGILLSPAVLSTPHAPQQTAERSQKKSSARPDRAEDLQVTGLRRQMRTASPRDLPKLAYQALEIPDASERREALLEAIRSTPDSATCVEVIAQFERISRETGRNHAPLLSAALFEAGKLYGPAMLDAWSDSETSTPFNYFWETMYGVSFATPTSARDWLERTDLKSRKPLVSAMIGGAALHDPDQASVMMAALSKEDRMESVSNFAYNTVQKEGQDRLIDWMLEVTSSSPEDEADYVAKVENHVFGGLVAAARSKGGELELARHLERINKVKPISAAQMIRTVSGLPGTQSLDLMDQLARSPEFSNLSNPEAALLQAVPHGVSRSLDLIGNWLDQHPDSPLVPAIRANLSTKPKH